MVQLCTIIESVTMPPADTSTALWRKTFAVIFMACVLGACGGGGEAAPQATSAIVGLAGGTVPGPGGAMAVVPAGALSVETAIEISQSSAGAPALPGSTAAAGPILAFTPHGIAFAAPVMVTVPFNPALVPAGQTPALYKTGIGQADWEAVASAAVSGDVMRAAVDSFSYFAVVTGLPPLTLSKPHYEWQFTTLPGDGQPEVLVSGGSRRGGILAELEEFGPVQSLNEAEILDFTGALPSDGFANGFIFASGNGITYGVFAEAPSARLGGVDPIGGATRLTQKQSFVKNAADATLSFTLSELDIGATDFLPQGGGDKYAINGEAVLSVGAYRTPTDFFFQASGRVGVAGQADTWYPYAEDESFSRSHLWSMDDFEFTVKDIGYDSGASSCQGKKAFLILKRPRTYRIDLSSVLVGEEFTVRADAYAETENRKGGGSAPDCEASSVGVFLRDPLSMDGTTWEFTGLTPTNNPLPTSPPTDVYEPPAACAPGPGPLPEAGELQFSAAFYAVNEAAGALQMITVTRTRGSVGAVTATFSTSDGTAQAGIDYEPVLTTVYFGDGDNGTRVVSVPVIANTFDQPDRTVVLSLSTPGGCAALGPLTSAVLTIIDDDLPPSAPPAGVLDANFGVGGEAMLPGFGGGDSAMALQGDGKIVMAGGTFTAFVLARFNADGSLDKAFGVNGTVSTSFAGTYQETARAVAIQTDGKIVVAGHATTNAGGTHQALALARYNADGSLDPGFGSGGLVFDGGISGTAYAVAIQPDDKIVVAGEGPIASAGPDYTDFQLARYDADGKLDNSFGTDGLVVINVDGTDRARRLVLQPDGAIVASGDLFGASSLAERTGVVRVDAKGALDASFGSGGTLVIDTAAVGNGLARQSDGKLVLGGTVGTGTARQYALMRLHADGSADTAFGTGGLVTTLVTGETDVVHAVALQGDGRILAGGEGSGVNRNFTLVRYLADGSVDTGFASGGKLVIDFAGFRDQAEAVAVQLDGKIVLGGLARDGSDGYGLARVNP